MQNQISKNWKIFKLQDLGIFKNGVNFSSDQMGKGLGLINVKDIFKDSPTIDYKSLDKVNLEINANLKNYFIKEKDIFFVRSSVKREGVGYVCYSEKDADDVIHCGFVIRFRMNTKNVDPIYLTYLLRTPTYRNVLMNIASGSAITNISQDVLKKLEIYVPPLIIQMKIVKLISSLDLIIKFNKQKMAILEEMAQLIYREWFVEFRFPGYEKAKMADSELGKIPEEWERKSIREMTIFSKGRKPKNTTDKLINNYLPHILIDGLRTGISGFADKKGMILVNEEDVIMVMDGASSSEVYTGFEGVLGSTLGVFKPINNKIISPYFIYHLLRQNREFLKNNNIGAAIPHASKDMIGRLEFVLPPQSTMIDFHQQFSNIHSLIRNIKNTNEKLALMRDLLLPKLMSGEIDVSKLDIPVEN